MFQAAGSCSGDGTQHMAHNHGCKRTARFVSPQIMMSCGNLEMDKTLYPDSAGCNGGEAADAWRFFFVNGVASMTTDGTGGCSPYTAGKCAAKDPLNNGCKTCSGAATECEDTGLPPHLYKVDSFGWIMEEGLAKRADTGVPRPASDMPMMKKQVEKMQIELMTNGPLHVCIDYHANFGTFFNQQPLGIVSFSVPLVVFSFVVWLTCSMNGLPHVFCSTTTQKETLRLADTVWQLLAGTPTRCLARTTGS